MKDNHLLSVLTTTFDFWQSFFVFISHPATRPSAGRRRFSFRPRPRRRPVSSWCSCAQAACWWYKCRPPRAFGSALAFSRPGNSGKCAHDCPIIHGIRYFPGKTGLFCPNTPFERLVFVSAGMLSHNYSWLGKPSCGVIEKRLPFTDQTIYIYDDF